MIALYLITLAIAAGMTVYTFFNDPDDADPKWDINNAPWRT